jgi:hypothetical protein
MFMLLHALNRMAIRVEMTRRIERRCRMRCSSAESSGIQDCRADQLDSSARWQLSG